MLRPWILVVAVVMSQGGVTSAADAQSEAVPNGRVVDSAGARLPQPLATVKVRAIYQKRPSIYSFMESEQSSRVTAVNPVITDWLEVHIASGCR